MTDDRVDLSDCDDDWDAWTPTELAARLDGVGVPWWVCGGWALDLFHGRQTREHEDLEFAVCRSDFGAVRDALTAGGDHQMFYVGAGEGFPLAPGALPPDEYTQVWTRERVTGRYRVDTFLDPGSRDEWVCKRDDRLRLPLESMRAVDAAGIGYQRPEVVLLMKAKHRRDKDDADLARAWPALDPPARRWFTDAVELIHPDHPWLDSVTRL